MSFLKINIDEINSIKTINNNYKSNFKIALVWFFLTVVSAFFISTLLSFLF